MCSASRSTSKPRQLPAAASGRSSPHSMRIVVVLPLPFGPRKPTISRSRTRRLMLSTTVVVPKRFVSPLTSMTFMNGPAPRA